MTKHMTEVTFTTEQASLVDALLSGFRAAAQANDDDANYWLANHALEQVRVAILLRQKAEHDGGTT